MNIYYYLRKTHAVGALALLPLPLPITETDTG
jgi:hypothetical protein